MTTKGKSKAGAGKKSHRISEIKSESPAVAGLEPEKIGANYSAPSERRDPPASSIAAIAQLTAHLQAIYPEYEGSPYPDGILTTFPLDNGGTGWLIMHPHGNAWAWYGTFASPVCTPYGLTLFPDPKQLAQLQERSADAALQLAKAVLAASETEPEPEPEEGAQDAQEKEPR